MAYRQSCAICRLRHKELLDSAHILPDLHPLSEPVVSNGLSLVLSTTSGPTAMIRFGPTHDALQ